MDFSHKFEIGDLIMCQALHYPDLPETEQNVYTVIGWIEQKILMTEANRIHTVGYKVRWSDRENLMDVTERDIIRLRNFFLENKKKMGL
jgi:hypothetical protein